MKFLADMGIALRTVAWLRQDGYDIVHLRDEGLQCLDDTDILIKARQERRIVLTVDLDFPRLLAVSRANLPSVILFRLGNENYNLINDRLSLILSLYRNELIEGVIISVSDDALRVRRLPII